MSEPERSFRNVEYRQGETEAQSLPMSKTVQSWTSTGPPHLSHRAAPSAPAVPLPLPLRGLGEPPSSPDLDLWMEAASTRPSPAPLPLSKGTVGKMWKTGPSAGHQGCPLTSSLQSPVSWPGMAHHRGAQHHLPASGMSREGVGGPGEARDSATQCGAAWMSLGSVRWLGSHGLFLTLGRAKQEGCGW